ncbi:MAG: hypothetical protein H6635_03160 [Anaerolineales bacterium]|nr:hypothetical protein [Anaerolineales bacterium]
MKPLDAAGTFSRRTLTVPMMIYILGWRQGGRKSGVVKQSVDALNRLREFLGKMKLKVKYCFNIENKDHVPFHKGGVFGTEDY